MEILVFKTNLTRQRLATLTGVLSSMRGLLHWSVDWEDHDRVLRIESDNLLPCVLIEQLQEVKIQCEELE